MKVDLYMPWFIGDYLRDTTDLNTEEHGAYDLILMSLWRAGGSLPLDRLPLVSKMPQDRWPKVWKTIKRFFEIDGDDVRQGRVTRELAHAQSKREKARENGRAGGRPVTQKEPDGKPRTKPTDNRTVNPGDNPGPNPQETSPDLRSDTQIPDRKIPPEVSVLSRSPRNGFEVLRLYEILWVRRWALLFVRKEWDPKAADALIAGLPNEATAADIRPAMERFLASEDPKHVNAKHPFRVLCSDFDAFRVAPPAPDKPSRLLTPIPMPPPNARQVAREMDATEKRE
jgi:uncharacterized protein YdaU (DUF1376 family)